MDKPSDAPMQMAPGPESGVSQMRLPSREEWPAVDDYLDEPETTRWERFDGERVWASPATPEHAIPHAQLDYLLVAHARSGYVTASDLKTRATAEEEFASDTCVLKKGTDPRTGRRYLEELSFEVVHQRSQKKVDARARAFSARGVRRQIAIFVRTGTVSEWDRTEEVWRPLDPSIRIHDKCLSRPLEVAALLDAARADDVVARALEAKGNPAIVEMKTESRVRGFEEGRAEGHSQGRAEGQTEGRAEGQAEGRAEGQAEGRARGRAEALLILLDTSGLEVSKAQRERILATSDIEALGRWLRRAAYAASLDDVLGDG